MARFQKIDGLLLGDHYHLQAGDECYFFVEYTSGKRYDYSKANRLISNLKKKPSTKSTAQWNYKIDAINACSNEHQALVAVVEVEHRLGFPVFALTDFFDHKRHWGERRAVASRPKITFRQNH